MFTIVSVYIASGIALLFFIMFCFACKTINTRNLMINELTQKLKLKEVKEHERS